MEETFINLVGELLNSAVKYFDLGFMLLYFLSNLVLLKKTVLSKKPKIWKQTFVVCYGASLGIIFLAYHYSLNGNIKSTIDYALHIGISMFGTILFYDLVYEILRNKLRTFIAIKKKIEEEIK